MTSTHAEIAVIAAGTTGSSQPRDPVRAGHQVRVRSAQRARRGGREQRGLRRGGGPAVPLSYLVSLLRPRSSTSWDFAWNCVLVASGPTRGRSGRPGHQRQEGRITRESFWHAPATSRRPGMDDLRGRAAGTGRRGGADVDGANPRVAELRAQVDQELCRLWWSGYRPAHRGKVR